MTQSFVEKYPLRRAYTVKSVLQLTCLFSKCPMVTIQKGHLAERKYMIILANSLYRQSDRHERTAATVRLKSSLQTLESSLAYASSLQTLDRYEITPDDIPVLFFSTLQKGNHTERQPKSALLAQSETWPSNFRIIRARRPKRNPRPHLIRRSGNPIIPPLL